MKTILLTKINENGKEQFWKAQIDGAKYTIEHGLVGGKIQKETKTIFEGKNIGKENETSPEQQAEFQISNKARKKLEQRGYKIVKGKDIIDANRGQEVKKVHTDVPEPMCAHDGTKRLKHIQEQECIIIQDKLDGFRGMSNGKDLYSRSRKSFTGKVPHLIKYIEQIRKQLDAEWVDGELYSEKITFNEIQSIMLKKPEKMTDEDFEKAKTIKFNLFDYMSDEPQIERTKKLNKLRLYGKMNKYVNILNSIILNDITKEKIDELHNDAVDRGNEGIMIRFPNSVYEYKRTYNLLKWKVFQDIEAKIVGITSEKNDPNKLGAMVMEYKGIKFNARPAMTDAEKDEIFNNQKKYIGQIGVIKYQNVDEHTGCPRFPIFKGLRAKIDIGK